MEKRQPLFFETLLDPFVVLTVCQILREMPGGESLELLVKGEKIPDELSKILTPEHYQITVMKSAIPPNHINVVIEKRKLPFTEGLPTSHVGRCCR
ncbi:MAG: hypothetical protein V2B20_17560 [Pseudomonadota bacterium]